MRMLSVCHFMGATPAVTKQADAGVAVLVAQYAHKGACSRGDGGARFSHASLLSCMSGSAFLSCLDTSVYRLSPRGAILGKSLPGFCCNAAGFEVPLAGIFVPESWATYGSRASCKLAVQDVLW